MSTTHDAIQDAVAMGNWTIAEQYEQEAVGEMPLPLFMRMISEYKPIIDGMCQDHKGILLRAVRFAIENSTPVEEIRGCVDKKLQERAGCLACKAVLRSSS